MPYSIRPRESDTECPDGFACYGWRQIHKGGYVNWYGRRYFHEDLIQWNGMFVYVRIDDWLAIALEIDEVGFDGRQIIARMESDDEYCARKKIVKPTLDEIAERLGRL